MKLEQILKERYMSRNQLAVNAGITPSDLYSAISGKKAFFPGWRKRIADYLQMEEEEVFPEYREE